MGLSVKDVRIGMIGLGYVGLPLTVEFGKKFPTAGFDINENRIRDLRSGSDRTLEVERHDLAAARHLTFTDATEEDCIPEIERVSGLKFNEDFFAGGRAVLWIVR